MTGKLQIIVKDDNIEVKGFLKGASLSGQVAIIDALMGAFELKGEDRKVAFEMLQMLDSLKSGVPEETLERLFKEIMKNLEDK